MIRKMFFSLVLLSSYAEVRPMEGDKCDSCLRYAFTGCGVLTYFGTIYSEVRNDHS